MPRGDGRGPNGEGPLTGRGMGYCRGNNFPGCRTNFARGMGRGFGQGRMGGGRRFWTTPEEMVNAYKEPTKEEILEELKTRKTQIEKTIKELEQEE